MANSLHDEMKATQEARRRNDEAKHSLACILLAITITTCLWLVLRGGWDWSPPWWIVLIFFLGLVVSLMEKLPKPPDSPTA